MRFSVIIPSYNNLGELKNCLSALNAVPRNDFEVFICLDGSTDGSWKWLQQAQFSFPCQILQHPENKNRGRSAARNLALSHISGDFVLLLDSDMEVAPFIFDRHEKVLVKKGHISIGSIRYQNRKSNLWVRYTSLRGVSKFPDGSRVPYQYFITPNTALPASWFKALSGFDEKINRYGGEDMEFAYRLNLEFEPTFIHNQQAVVGTSQPKKLLEALPQLKEYGGTGLPYIRTKWPELKEIYWLNKCESSKIKDRLFEQLTKNPFRKFAFFLLRISPFFIQKELINYLVISYVHWGFRERDL